LTAVKFPDISRFSASISHPVNSQTWCERVLNLGCLGYTQSISHSCSQQKTMKVTMKLEMKINPF